MSAWLKDQFQIGGYYQLFIIFFFVCLESNFTLPVRLRDGNVSFEGRLEVLEGGVWGTVCDSFFNIRKGNIVCRQLGFLKAKKVFNFAHYPMASNNTPIVVNSVRCTGYESQFGDCTTKINPWSIEFCSHADDVGVVCVGKVTNFYY